MNRLIAKSFFAALAALAPLCAAAKDKGSQAISSAIECRSLSADAERLACYDAAIDGLAAARAQADASSQARKENFGLPQQDGDQPRVTETPADFGAEDVPELRADREKDRLSSITATTTKITINSLNVATFYLDNGQVWRQLGSDDVVYRGKKDPQSVEIKRGALANYMLKVDGFARPLRVQRIK